MWICILARLSCYVLALRMWNSIILLTYCLCGRFSFSFQQTLYYMSLSWIYFQFVTCHLTCNLLFLWWILAKTSQLSFKYYWNTLLTYMYYTIFPQPIILTCNKQQIIKNLYKKHLIFITSLIVKYIVLLTKSIKHITLNVHR